MKKKLLFIIWSNSYGGGAERQLTNLVNNLNKEKYEIDVIEYFHTDIHPEQLAPHINELKPINNQIKESKIKREIVNRLVHKYPSLIRKLYIKKKYDLEISFNYLIPTFLLSKKEDTKTISWIHGAIWDIEKEKEPWLYNLQKENLKNVDRIVTIAEDTKKSIVTLYPEYKNKTQIIYNGYDFDTMKELANKEKLQKSKVFEIIYCNRFDDNKDPLFLIEAAKELKNKTNKFHISMLGKGILENKMKGLIKEYDLQDNVTILGYKDNPYPYIKNADIMCLTSRNEGFSNVIIEGLIFGKPFVSTNVGIVQEIKKENVGLVVNSSKEMAKAFYELMEDKCKYKNFSQNCKKVAKKFELKTQIKQAESLFDELLKH